MYRIAIIIMSFICVSCASQQMHEYEAGIPVAAEIRTKDIPTDVHLVLTEIQLTEIPTIVDTTSAHINTVSSGNPAADIIGHLIGEFIIQASAAAEIEKYKDPLLDFTTSHNIDTQYTENIKQALDQWGWFKIEDFKVERQSSVSHIKDQEDGRVSKSSNSFLKLYTRYYYSTDYRTLFVDTQAEWRSVRHAAEPEYRSIFRFVSPSIGSTDLEATLNLWSENNGWRFRNTLSMGLEENLRMIVDALQENVVLSPPPKSNMINVNYRNRVGGIATVLGWTKQTSPEMMTITTEAGDRFCIVQKDLSLEDFDLKLAAINANLVFSAENEDNIIMVNSADQPEL